jgi:HemY protein
VRWIVFIVILVAGAVIAGFLTQNPGSVLIEWRQYRITTSVAFSLAAVVVSLLLFGLMSRLLLALRNMPRAMGHRKEQRQNRDGYAALRQALFAISSGDGRSASQQAKKAGTLLGDSAVSTLLAAQAAQVRGDTESASRHFSSLRSHPAAELSAIKGLLTEAEKRKDLDAALALAEKAYALSPNSDWVVNTLYDLRKRTGAWSDAAAVPVKSDALRLVSPDHATRERAELLHRQSLAASGSDALDWAKKAYTADPSFTPGVVCYAHLLIGAGKPRRAAEIIEESWKRYPAPEVADAYADAVNCGSALEKVQVMQRLAAYNPDHIESHLAIAVAALDANLWGEARKHLAPVVSVDPSPRVCRLMAAVEESENGDLTSARQWLTRAAGGESDDVPRLGESDSQPGGM